MSYRLMKVVKRSDLDSKAIEYVKDNIAVDGIVYYKMNQEEENDLDRCLYTMKINETEEIIIL